MFRLRIFISLGRVRRSKVLGTTAELASQREAQLRLDRYLSAHNYGRRRPESKMKFRDFINGRWLADVLPNFKLSTRLQYEYFMRRHLLPYFGEWKLEDIRPEEVQRFMSFHPNLAPKTIRSMAATLSSSLQRAVMWGFIESNAVKGLTLPRKWDVRERHALALEQVSALLQELHEPCRTIVILMVLTGMRIGEVLGLRWGKIHPTNKLLVVDEGVYEKEVSTPKTKCGVRTLPLSDFLVAQLEAWRGRGPSNPDDLVFPNQTGMIQSRRNLARRQLLPAARAIGLNSLGWHDLRRTHGTWLKDVGAAPGVIQNQLGHADPHLALLLYVMSVPGEQRAMVDKASSHLELLLDPNSTHAASVVRRRCNERALQSAG